MLAAEEQSIKGQLGRIQVRLLSALFVILGLAPFVYLISSIPLDPQIIYAQEEGKSLVLAFLDSFGIILPLVLIAFSFLMLKTAIGVAKEDINAAQWAKLILLWLIIIGVAGLAYVVTMTENSLPLIIGLLAFEAAFIYFYVWLGNNLHEFSGEESLMARSTRTAWNLLVPTVAVLLLVAARPLEQTFISSLTNRVFAGVSEVNYVGLDNYTRLLGFRIDNIPCQVDEGGACLTDDNGNTLYERPRDALGDEYRELRFRSLSEHHLFGNYYVVSVRDANFMQAVGNTLYFTFFSVTLELILGLFIALVVNSNFPGRGILRTAMLVPWAIPTVVSARLWETMLRDNSSGVINQMLMGMGIVDRPLAWLADTSLQLPALIAVDVWKTTPFMALILLAGLQVIPSDIYEAADVDGASKIRQFFRITLPLLRPTIAVALVFRTVDALRAFDVFQVLLGRQKLSMATYNYEQLIANQQFGYASAIGVVIFVLILIFTVIYVKALGVTNE